MEHFYLLSKQKLELGFAWDLASFTSTMLRPTSKCTGFFRRGYLTARAALRHLTSLGRVPSEGELAKPNPDPRPHADSFERWNGSIPLIQQILKSCQLTAKNARPLMKLRGQK